MKPQNDLEALISQNTGKYSHCCGPGIYNIGFAIPIESSLRPLDYCVQTTSVVTGDDKSQPSEVAIVLAHLSTTS